MKYKAAKTTLELIDRVNPSKKKYKQKPNFDLISFTWTKAAGYYWLYVTVTGDIDGREIPVYQIDGKPVELEKVETLIYRYIDPEDEQPSVRLFEVSVDISDTVKKTKQVIIETEPFIYYLTSTIYPINLIDDLSNNFSTVSGRMLTSDNLGLFSSATDELENNIKNINWDLKKVLREHDYFSNQSDNIDSVSNSFKELTGTLREVLVTSTIKPEDISTTVSLITGTLRTILINYTYYKPEEITNNLSNLNGAMVELPEYFESYIDASTLQYNESDTDAGFTTIVRNVNNSQITNDPVVYLQPNAKSVLDFENGVVDKIGVTIWDKNGTGTVTSTNKIFGSNSFETKALGDSLYTNSNIISGGGTPFTIEFYALINKQTGWSDANYIQAPLFSKNGEGSSQNQQVHINFANGGKSQLIRQSNIGNGVLDSVGKYSVKYNEINKYSISYDGAALRLFINDKLDNIVGTSAGIVMTTALPFKFFDTLVTNYSQYRTGSNGIIDNINILDGVATKVRDYDPNDHKLIIDLALDGENNSTKIVDNGLLKTNWTVNGNAKISTTQNFDSFSSLSVVNSTLGTDYIIYDQNIDLKNTDYTVSMEFYLNSFINEYSTVLMASKLSNGASGSCITVTGVADNRIVSVNFNSLNYIPGNLLKGTTSIQLNKKYKIDVVVKNNTCSLYLNGVLENAKTIDTSIIEFTLGGGLILGRGGTLSNTSPSINEWLSSVNGFIKNFKVYKGVAIVPEVTTGKIELNFDNNLSDKYSNSTWTNNNVTFSQINSIKGYASYFNQSTSRITCGTNSNLNFEDKNFLVSFDIKRSTSSTSANLLTSGATSYPTNWVEIFCRNSNLGYNNQIVGYSLEVPIGLPLNNYYKFDLIHKNVATHIKINDVIVGTDPSRFITNNFNANSNTVIGGSLQNGSQFNGYIDNFKSIKDYSEEVIIDRPAVELPLETNTTSLGFTPLTVNAVGSPIYTIIDNKKCIKFEQGKYLTITSNNIFNLGVSSDFYIEFMYYNNSNYNYNVLLSNQTIFDSNSIGLVINSTDKKLRVFNNTIDFVVTDSILNNLVWNKIKWYRSNGESYLQINDEAPTKFSTEPNLDLSKNSLFIGTSGWYTNDSLDGYMSDFKLIVGSSKLSNNYDSKKIFDLDFKPTNKSYLFKDNTNKHIIHPINLTQRDYKDSSYCATFNGTDQYLSLGKAPAFNFGFDDFILKLRFKMNDMTDAFNMLINGYHDGNSTNRRAYIGVGGSNRGDAYTNKLLFDISNDSPNVYLSSDTSIVLGSIYDVVLVSRDKVLRMYVNNVLQSQFINSVTGINFNESDNTLIAANGISSPGSDSFASVTLYDIKVWRNTSDLSLVGILKSDKAFTFENTLTSTDNLSTFINNDGNVTYVTTKSTQLYNKGVTTGSIATSYLSIGSEPTFNFGTSDFDLSISARYNTSSTDAMLIASGQTSLVDGCVRVGLNTANELSFSRRNSTSFVDYFLYRAGASTKCWFKSQFIRKNNVAYTIINDSLYDMKALPATVDINLNGNNSTYISSSGWLKSLSQAFKGDIDQISVNKSSVVVDQLPMNQLPLVGDGFYDLGVINKDWSIQANSSAAAIDGVNCYRLGSSRSIVSSTIVLMSEFNASLKFYIPEAASNNYRIPILGKGALISDTFVLYAYNNNTIVLENISGSVTLPYSLNTWNYVEVYKTGSTLYFKLNGVLSNPLAVTNESMYTTTNAMYIAGSSSTAVQDKDIYITDFNLYGGTSSKPSNNTYRYKKLDLDLSLKRERDYLIGDKSKTNVITHSSSINEVNLVNVKGLNCISFNGTDNYLTINYNKGFNLDSDPYTIVTSFLPTNTSSATQTIWSNGATSAGSVIALQLDGVNNILKYIINGTTINLGSVVMYDWNTVNIKANSSGITVELNNVVTLYNLFIICDLDAGSVFKIGAGVYQPSTTYFTGFVSDLRIYKGTTDDLVIKADSTLTETVVIPNPPLVVTYPLELNKLEAFGTDWNQMLPNYPVVYREFGKGNTALYFDGAGGIQSSNKNYRLGMSKFTIELDFLISTLPTSASYPMPVLSYGINYAFSGWYQVSILNTGVIRFGTYSNGYYISSPTGTIVGNKKYRLAITRDENQIVRLFIDGIKVAEGLFNTSLDGDALVSYSTSQNYLNLGKFSLYHTSTSSNYSFRGYIDNFHITRGICSYIENYTVNDVVKISSQIKSLLNANQSDIGTTPSSIVDASNNLNWTNSGVTVTSYSNLRGTSFQFSTITNNLTSSVSNDYVLGVSDLTLDLTFTVNQTTSDTVLLDMRQNSSSYSGLLITQPSGSPASLTIQIGSISASTGFDFTYNTGANTILTGVVQHLRIVRCLGDIYIFLNGALKTTLTVNTLNIGTRNKVILGNNELNTKGFNGYITQFRLIKGTASNVYAFTKLTKELT